MDGQTYGHIRKDGKSKTMSLRFCSKRRGGGAIKNLDDISLIFMVKKVQVGNDQKKAQSEKDSHSKNRGGKKQTSN